METRVPEVELRTYEVEHVWRLPKAYFWITKEAFEEDVERKVVEELLKQRDELGRVPTYVGTVSFEWTEDWLNWYCRHTWRFRGFYSASPISPLVYIAVAAVAGAIIAFFAWLAISKIGETIIEVVPPIIEKVPAWGWGLLTAAAVITAGAYLVRAVRK